MDISPPGLRKVGRGEEMDILKEGSGFHASKNRQQQPRPNGQIPSRQGDNKACPSNPTEGAPREQVWVDNVEAPARAKNLRVEDTLTLAQRVRLNQEQERAGNCE